jgi:Organic solute transporter Ostalpha
MYRNKKSSNNSNANDYESECLLSPIARVRQSTERLEALGKGIWCNRGGILVLVIVFCLYTLYSQSQISQLSLQIEDVTDRLHTLEVTTQQQSVVIDRFNSSVTNADIVLQLQEIQNNFSSTTHALHNELRHTKEEIQTQLTDTILALNQTVDAAETEIYNQVSKVELDVEHYVITTQDQFSMENSFMVYQLAGTFTVLSCLISMWHMTQHLRKLHQPDVQRKILAILWMSPIYAITSWFSLVFHSAEGYLAILKDFYEAYVIYQFLSFCIAVLGKGDRNVVVQLLAQHADHLTPPVHFGSACEVITCGRACMAPKFESARHLADAVLLQCQIFAVQFVFFRPATTTAMVVLQNMNYYGPIEINTDYNEQIHSNSEDLLRHFYSPQFYITIIQNISIFVAFTGLLKFYHAVDQELAWCRPFAKFLCIKGVVFMTFWQGLVLSVLAQTTDLGRGSNSSTDNDNAVEWAKSAQNFLICLEMLLFSIAHFYCFPTEEWEDGYRVKHTVDGSNFGDSIALGDFLSDLKLILKTGKKSKKTKKLSSPPSLKIDPTIPEGDDESDGNQTLDMNSSVASSIPNSSNSHDGNNGNHDNNDDDMEDVKSTNDRSEEDSQVIARALQESLGELADDPEIVEATKRLLDSKVLTLSFFDYNNDHHRRHDNLNQSDSCNGTSNNFMNGDVSNSTPSKSEHQIDSDIDAFISEFTTSPHEPPTEHTTLLASRTTTTSTTPSLRPSIFTTIASMAENEDPDR